MTANKALLAAHGTELHAVAESNGVDLYYEAAVAGAIPIVRPLRGLLSEIKSLVLWASSMARPTTSLTK